MLKLTRRVVLAALASLLGAAAIAQPIPQNGGFWQSEVDKGNMPPVAERLPEIPKIVDLEQRGGQSHFFLPGSRPDFSASLCGLPQGGQSKGKIPYGFLCRCHEGTGGW